MAKSRKAKRAKKLAQDIELWDDEEKEEIIWVSKSEIKRDAEILKELGENLVNLTPGKLAKINLPENIFDAVTLAQRLQKEARRRQLQYVGKLLRNVDAEPIQEALDKLENKHQHQQAILHKIEFCREELILEGDQALSALLNEYPQIDRQQLRSLIRSAQKEKKDGKHGRAYKEIFVILKALMLIEE